MERKASSKNRHQTNKIHIKAWFKQRKKFCSRRRSFGDIGYAEVEEHEVVSGEDEQDRFIPWVVYKRRRLAEGMGDDQAKEAWLTDLADDEVDKAMVRGQWCVAEFEGVLRSKGKMHRTKTAVTRGMVKTTTMV